MNLQAARVLSVAGLVWAAACAETPMAAGQSTGSAGASQDQVVAEVAGRTITLKDVDARWEEYDAAERARVTQLLYQNRRNMLDQLVGQALIDEAAKAAGATPDAFLAAEIAKRAKPVEDGDIQQFFDENKDRTQGRTLDQLREPIRAYLADMHKAQAQAQVVDELKAKATNVKLMLDPPRYSVALVDHDPVRGDQAAPITIIEFSDYQCPFCGKVTPTLERVRQAYGAKVRIVFKDFPLDSHPLAPKAAEAAHCAGDQGKYWEMHDHMFANQRALDVPSLKATAQTLGLDAAQFGQCLDSGKWAAAVKEDQQLGLKLGVNSTPSLYINGRSLVGAQPFEAFKTIIDEELAFKGK